MNETRRVNTKSVMMITVPMTIFVGFIFFFHVLAGWKGEKNCCFLRCHSSGLLFIIIPLVHQVEKKVLLLSPPVNESNRSLCVLPVACHHFHFKTCTYLSLWHIFAHLKEGKEKDNIVCSFGHDDYKHDFP